MHCLTSEDMEVTRMKCCAQIYYEVKNRNKAFCIHGLWILYMLILGEFFLCE